MPLILRAAPVWALAATTILFSFAAHGAEPAQSGAAAVAPQEAAPPITPAQAEFFELKVRPLFANHCSKCHSKEKHKGGLTIVSRAALLKGGDSGPAFVPGNPDESLLIGAIRYDGLEMPPTGKLSDNNIAILTEWVKQGAPWPNDTGAKPVSHDEFKITDEDRRYWAFQPIKKPAVPAVKQTEWVKSPIDAFILARLESAELKPSPPADKRTLIRRVYFDLIGLPPTPEEVERFVSDATPNAYERVVDDLLSRQQYGERWGRYWLDLVRFAQTNGYERDDEKEFAWRYRDYVINALNGDKPFDRFVVEQLAGDEVDDVSHESVIATGFYRLGVWDDEPDDRRQAEYDELDDVVRTVGSAFLGMTLGCARCHDHKFDPLAQEDYYGLVAFFRNIELFGTPKSDTHLGPNMNGIYTPLTSREQMAAWNSECGELQGRLTALSQQVDQLCAVARQKLFDARLAALPEDLRTAYATAADKRTGEQPAKATEAERLATPDPKDVETALDEEARKEKQKLDQEMGRISEKLKSDPFVKALSVRESGAAPRETFVLTRGNPATPAKKVAPRVPEICGGALPEIAPVAASVSANEYRGVLAELGVKPTTRLRLALAYWIVSENNPLTARVAVNRAWQHLFGRGIVPTPNNFGRTGLPPTHPELLDWLAAEFVEGGWRFKRLQKQIVMSSTYRMSSRAHDEQGMDVDPGNDLFWHQNLRRLDADAIRDSILATSGQLNPQMGGRGIFPALSQDVLSTQSRPGAGWDQNDASSRARRSVYIYVKRTLMVPMLETFDYTNTAESLGDRPVTTVAPQALLLLNSEFMQEQARALAARIIREARADQNVQVERAFRLALLRGPTDNERKTAQHLLERQYERFRSLPRPEGNNQPPGDELLKEQALGSLCLVMLNLNEFMYID